MALRFVVGGAMVSLFAVAGRMFEPKTFAGLFGAAPSVAIATLALAWGKYGPEYVAVEARSMLVGAVAMLVYGTICVAMEKRRAMPAWLGAGLAWAVWFAVAIGSWQAVRAAGGGA